MSIVLGTRSEVFTHALGVMRAIELSETLIALERRWTPLQALLNKAQQVVANASTVTSDIGRLDAKSIGTAGWTDAWVSIIKGCTNIEEHNPRSAEQWRGQ